MKGFIVYPTYEIINGETQIQLFGKLENGQSFVALNTLEPYFFIKAKDEKKVSKYLKTKENQRFSGLQKSERFFREFKVEKTKLSNFKGEPVAKISSQTPTELNKLYKEIHKKIDTYEADIKPHYRFLMDKNLLGTIDVEGHFESSEKIDRIYQNPEITPSDFKPKLKVASLDIETDKKSDKLFCIGIYSENYKKVFFVTDKKLDNAISCSSESECLEKFKSEILKLDPDIITGWNLIDFDLKFLSNLFKKNKISFDIGRTNREASLRIESGFFRSSSANVPGRQVLDALNLIRDPFIKEAPSIKNTKFESYTLEDVSQAILNDGKFLKGKTRHDEIERLYKLDPQKIVDYNLQDCKLAYEILEKTKTIDLAVERSQLTGMPLDRITGSIASFDSLYIREARSRGIVSPTLRFKDKEEKIKGGFVRESKPGIYHNVLVLDFKSLYPSILRTFNIDPSSQLEKKEKGAIESPNKAYFKNQQGILPIIIERLHKAREKAKKEKRELSNYAIKIIMNSFWGVLASPNCRYFNLDMANAITNFGQFIIKLTAKQVESKGLKVIYSDTDSIFVDTELSKEKANALGKEIESEINNFYKNYVKKNYDRESFLELQFEKQYLAFMIPKVRGSEAGAKKRYAGLIEKSGVEKIEIIGLEAIRGDWTEAAQDFQRELLDKVFHKQEIAKFIKSYIKDLEAGNLDKKLIYKKSIRKNLDEYTKTTPPHVKAARKLAKLDSNIIQYYITTEGPEPIQNHQNKIDYKHYIDKQIKPIANQVLALFSRDFDDVIANSKQATLF